MKITAEFLQSLGFKEGSLPNSYCYVLKAKFDDPEDPCTGYDEDVYYLSVNLYTPDYWKIKLQNDTLWSDGTEWVNSVDITWMFPFEQEQDSFRDFFDFLQDRMEFVNHQDMQRWMRIRNNR